MERISTLEKECASLELELKATQNKYEQEVKAHRETEKSRLVSKEEANMEEVKGLQITLFIKLVTLLLKLVAKFY